MSYREVVAKTLASSVSVPLLTYLSGVIFVRFSRFYSVQWRNENKLNVVLGTLAILIHAAQVAMEVVTFYRSNQSLLSGLRYNVAGLVAVQSASDLCLMIIVQYHFVRIAFIMYKFPKTISFPIVSFCLLSLAGGVGAFTEVVILGARDKLPATIYTKKVVVLTAVWILGASLCHIGISLGLLFVVCSSKISAKQKSTRVTLKRVIRMIVRSTALSTIGAMLYIVSLLSILKVGDKSLVFDIRLTSSIVLLNSLFPRIYLFAFFSSFATHRERHAITSESCVASFRQEGTTGVLSNAQQTEVPIEDQVIETYPRIITHSSAQRDVLRTRQSEGFVGSLRVSLSA